MSVSVNVVLAIAVVAVWRRPVSSGVEAQPLARVVTNVTPKIVVGASTNEAVPGLAERIQWREVASEDLTNYVANLRRVGCPAATVRDIIAGELQDIFLRRRKALIAPLQNEFWNLAMRGMDRSDGPFEKVKEQIDQLEKETIDRLDELAGADSEKKADEQRRRSKAFSYLPEEKQAALVALNEKFANLRRAARGSEANSNPAARERLAELQKQREADAQKIASDAEDQRKKDMLSAIASINAVRVRWDDARLWSGCHILGHCAWAAAFKYREWDPSMVADGRRPGQHATGGLGRHRWAAQLGRAARQRSRGGVR